MFSKLFGQKNRAPETPEACAARFAEDLISTLDKLYTHSYVFTHKPRGMIIEEEGQSLEYTVSNDLLFDYVVRFEDTALDEEAAQGLSEDQFSAQLAEYMHDTLTGWTEEYHLERRKELGLD